MEGFCVKGVRDEVLEGGKDGRREENGGKGENARGKNV